VFLLKNNKRPFISSFIHQDEKTLYVTVLFKYGTHNVICDFIYIIDQQDMYGAISINKHYEKARAFVKQHFQQLLLYSDEMILANNFMNTVSFKYCLQQFVKRYPTFNSSKIVS